MNKLFKWLTGDVFDSIGKVIDDLFTNDEERIKAKNELYKVLIDKSKQTEQIKGEIIQAEARGNWLQRSWRPILMLSFGAICLFHYAVYPILKVFNPELPVLPLLMPDFWELLKIGVGGYVVGRSAEKIIKDVSISGISINKKNK